MIRSSGVMLSTIGLLIALPLAASGNEPSFADLLSRAHTQARAGHQWAPAGDNVAETFMTMVNLLPQATPEQLADFEALLRDQQKQIAVSSNDGVDPGATTPPDIATSGTTTSSTAPPGVVMPPGAATPGTDTPLPSAQLSGSSATAADAQPFVTEHRIPANQVANDQGASVASDGARNPSSPVASPEHDVATPLPSTTENHATGAALEAPAEKTATAADPTDPPPNTLSPSAQERPPGSASSASSEAVNQPVQGGGQDRGAGSDHPGVASAVLNPPPAPQMAEPAARADSADQPASAAVSVPSALPANPDPPAAGAHDADVKIATASPSAPPLPAPFVPRLPPMAPPQAAAAKSPHVAAPSQAFTTNMFMRGRTAEQHGDISGARRFYAVAAQNGYAEAARSLARLYDPAYLRQKTIGGIDADPQLAQQWYDRAAALDAQASHSQPQALTAR